MAIGRLNTYLFLGTLAVFVATFFLHDPLPPPAAAHPNLHNDPIQLPTDAKPFDVELPKFNKRYRITPLYTYELWGMIVTYHNRGENFDLFTKSDPFQSRDDCVVWGSNITSDLYRNVRFASGDFTCYFRYTGETASSYDLSGLGTHLSNNHLLPADDTIHKRITAAVTGDQIHFKGYLVRYEVSDLATGMPLGTRDTSTVRTDNGCEVVYVTEFEVLARGSHLLRNAHTVSMWGLLAEVILALGILVAGSRRPRYTTWTSTGSEKSGRINPNAWYR